MQVLLVSGHARKAARADPAFCVTYESMTQGFIQKYNRTKEANDDFAEGMLILGAKSVTKLHFVEGKWESYV
jgi:hypothetical protein